MRMSVIRIERERAIEQLLRLRVVGPRRAVVQHLSRQHALVGLHVVGRLALGTIVPGRLDAALQGSDNAAGHLVLNGKHILELTIVSFRPDMPVGFRDRKSTRLNSSHMSISYAVFCLKK